MNDNDIITAIDRSPLTPEDKEHWKQILPKLTGEQREQLHHSLVVKTDIASAKAAVDRALKIIDDAEKEATEEITKEEVTQKAGEEIQKEIDTQNPMMTVPSEITKEELTSHKNLAEDKLQQLRRELAQISFDAHGSPPPSVVAPPKQFAPGTTMS